MLPSYKVQNGIEVEHRGFSKVMHVVRAGDDTMPEGRKAPFPRNNRIGHSWLFLVRLDKD